MKLAGKATAVAMIISVLSAVQLAADEAVTLQKARELALSKSSALRKAELTVNAASLTAQSERYSFFPSISVSADGSVSYGTNAPELSDSAAGSAKLSASETFYNGGRTIALAKKYNLATEAARETLRGTRISLIGEADAAFYAVLSAAASAETATSDLAAASLRLQIAKAKVEAGNLSRSDYLQTEAETAGYQTALTTAKKTLASAKAKLASLTGLPPSTALTQVDFASYDDLMKRMSGLDDAAIDKLVSDLVAMAKKNNPTLSGYALSSGEARAAIAAAKAGYLPTLSAGFSHGLTNTKAEGVTTSGSVSLTATLSLDLWNTKNAVDSAKVAAQQADLDSDEGLRSIELDVTQAVYEWLAAARAVSSSAKALEYAQANYENVLEKFKLSSATASDLSTAEALVSGDKTALISARFAFLSDLSALRGYAGLEDETAILKAVP
jgi:outer membrane protein